MDFAVAGDLGAGGVGEDVEDFGADEERVFLGGDFGVREIGEPPS